MSGEFKEKIGKTISICSGNDPVGKKTAVVTVELYSKKIIREII